MAEVSVLRSGATLAAIAALCTALVAFTYELTNERIATNEQAWLEQNLKPALGNLTYDGGIGDSRITIRSPHGLPGSEDVLVYRVYSAGAPVAALFVVNARDGYSGPIRLLVGVGLDGRLTGIHVLEHRDREPDRREDGAQGDRGGLGRYIESGLRKGRPGVGLGVLSDRCRCFGRPQS